MAQEANAGWTTRQRRLVYDSRRAQTSIRRTLYPGYDPRLQEQLHPVGIYPIDLRDGEIFAGLPAA